MSLFRAARGEVRSSANWFATGVDNPMRITADNATRLAPVFAAYRHIVDYVSTLPVDAYRLDGKSRREVSLPRLLARQDEPGGPGLVTWLGQAAYGLAGGNAVGWITEMDGFGFPTDLNWLHWSQWNYNELTKQWYVLGQPVPSSQLVHIPWIVPPGRRLGLSPIEQEAAIISAGLSAQEYADVRRGGGLPPVTIKNTQRTVPPEVASAMRNRAAATFAKGEPFILGNDWDLNMTTVPPNQAQFVQTLKMTANQIAAAFGIDPTEVGGEAANSLTYSTEELRQIRRAADMKPYLVRIERGLSRVMPLKQFIKLNVDADMRVDIKTRIEIEGAQIADGRMSVNEARELEDREPVPGGDFHNVPTPLTPSTDPTNPYSLARSNGQPAHTPANLEEGVTP